MAGGEESRKIKRWGCVIKEDLQAKNYNVLW